MKKRMINMIIFKVALTIITGIWLCLCSLQDIKKKQINLLIITFGFICIFALSILCIKISLINRLAGLFLGLLFLILNPITKGQIGIGDGLIICGMGLSFGFHQNSEILVLSLFGSALYSIILIIFKRVNRKKTIPFIPFLFLGYLGVIFY
jgi:leader peptidase (prepilin peptidase)/N-methyltransferase